MSRRPKRGDGKVLAAVRPLRQGQRPYKRPRIQTSTYEKWEGLQGVAVASNRRSKQQVS